MRNSTWLSRGACTLMTAIGAVSAAALPASAQASTPSGGHPSASASPSASSSAPSAATEWWLSAVSAQQEWSADSKEGSGVTVAVLSSGVDTGAPDLTGNVAPGPNFTGIPGTGSEGTEVASLIAGHGHGDGTQGITGVAPKARVLSVRVTLDPRDPRLSQASTVDQLPSAIAKGIDYAVGHGAQVIDLPLDPATIALGKGGERGGSPAEQAAVRNAIAHNAVVIAPAGDTGSAQDTSYPAAYPGVVSVGATDQNGQLAPFSSTEPYVMVTAPGAGVTAARPGSGYATLSSTDASAAMVAGVAALVRSRYPQLSGAQVAKALRNSAEPVSSHQPGAGAGAVTATNAVNSAGGVVSLIGTSTPKLVSDLPEEAAIGGGVIVVLGLIIFAIVRLRRREPDADIPDWGDGLNDSPPAGEDDPANQRGPGSPGRRASAADAVGRAVSARIARESGPIPQAPPWNPAPGQSPPANPLPTRRPTGPFPGVGMPEQGSNPISGPMRTADSELPKRNTRKHAHPGSHRR